MMLLEREGQLADLHQALDHASDGSGALILVGGEAGAGKTSLVRAFVASLNDSSLVIGGACDPLTTPRPLGPLHDFAADPNSGLSDLDFDESTSFQLFEMVLDRLRNTIRPIVMVVEDVHWADDATLDFLRFMGRRIGDSKAIVVCTYRDDEVGPDHPLRPVLGQLIPLPTTARVLVPPLTITAVRALAAGHEVDPEALLALTDGNAFYVTEVLAAGHSVPESVQEAVLARVARLGERPRRVVEAVSIAPRSLDIEHATALVGGTVEHVDAALGAGVLIGDGRLLRFRHELARSAVEDSIPPARRLGLHVGMLALLDEDSDPDLARMAHHAVQAGDGERIAQYAPMAAREASRRGAHREAISFLEAAIVELDRTGRTKPAAALRIDLGIEYRTIDRAREAVPAVERAVTFYRDQGQTAELGMALVELCRTRWRLNDPDKGMSALEEALALPFDASTRHVEAEAYYQLAYLHMLGRRGSAGREALAHTRKSAAGEELADLMWRIGMLDGTLDIVLADTEIGIEKLTRSISSARSANDPSKVAIALMMLGSGGGEARAYRRASQALEEAIEHGTAHDEDYHVAYCRSWLARIAHEQGRWDDAVHQAELVGATVSSNEGIAYMTAMSALGRVRVRRGDPGGLRLLNELTNTGDHHELQHIWNAICGRAEHFWLIGQPEGGHDLLIPAYERALQTDSEWARGEIGFWMWRTGTIVGPPDGAAEPFHLQMAGDWQASATLWHEIGCPYEEGMALADGDRDAKLQALAIFDSLGARPESDRLRAELRQAGVESIPRGPARSTRANPAGLTNRQVEVIELMAQGMSNAEIAEKLFISRKTVEHHVSAILTKLGAGSRTKAMATFERIAN
ncbi:MAG: AAA family ATPase [Actinobacteria bacterium]|nr:AAA family ATPase [Actinomycetota bacterium]